MIEKLESSSATPVAIALPSLNKVTLLPASAIPSIVGVESFVNEVEVVIKGLIGAVESIENYNSVELSEIFPALSVAVAVIS